MRKKKADSPVAAHADSKQTAKILTFRSNVFSSACNLHIRPLYTDPILNLKGNIREIINAEQTDHTTLDCMIAVGRIDEPGYTDRASRREIIQAVANPLLLNEGELNIVRDCINSLKSRQTVLIPSSEGVDDYNHLQQDTYRISGA